MYSSTKLHTASLNIVSYFLFIFLPGNAKKFQAKKHACLSLEK